MILNTKNCQNMSKTCFFFNVKLKFRAVLTQNQIFSIKFRFPYYYLKYSSYFETEILHGNNQNLAEILSFFFENMCILMVYVYL